MLRDDKDRDMGRPFITIETWEEFLNRWRRADTEGEAVGLLYEGVRVPIPKCEWVRDEAPFFLERVQFYLKWAGHKNQRVSNTAKQLLIKHWLRKVHWFKKEYLETHRLLLDFLVCLAREASPRWVDRRPEILQPPYPRYVSKYLVEFFEPWHHSGGAFWSEEDHQALQSLTDLFATALCFWGMSFVLARDYRGKDAVPAIKRFLEERDYEAGKAFMTISGHGEPEPDLSFLGAQERVNTCAALALLKIQYWIGDGVKEKFERRFPGM